MSGNRGKRVDDGGYSAALDAYRAGDYVRVAQLLQKAQAESAVAGDATMARILGATQHLFEKDRWIVDGFLRRLKRAAADVHQYLRRHLTFGVTAHAVG